MKEILERTKDYAVRYLAELPEKRAFPTAESIKELEKLAVPLPASGTSPEEVLRLLDTAGSPNTVASTGGRYLDLYLAVPCLRL